MERENKCKAESKPLAMSTWSFLWKKVIYTYKNDVIFENRTIPYKTLKINSEIGVL